MKQLLFLSPLFLFLTSTAQTTPNDGNWKYDYVRMRNTPEAQYMIRFGDIDNLGFGWEAGFTPFSGKPTPPHPYPWERDKKDTLGLDMILLPSSMLNIPTQPCGGDGYSGQFQMMKDSFGRVNFPIRIPIDLPAGTAVKSASMQLFLDDFQAPVFCSKFEATLNGRRAPFIEQALNALNQTGPIGKLVTLKIPADFLDSLKTPVLTLTIDDNTTGAGDGFAIDFVKILINPAGVLSGQKGIIKGIVRDPATGKSIPGAKITLSDGRQITSDAKGAFSTDAVAGLVVIIVDAKGYPEKVFTVDVLSGETTAQDLDLTK